MNWLSVVWRSRRPRAALPVLAWFALSDSISMNSTAQTPWATPLRLAAVGVVRGARGFALVAIGSVLRALGLAARAGSVDAVDREYGPRGTKEELQEELDDIEARGAAAAAGAVVEGKQAVSAAAAGIVGFLVMLGLMLLGLPIAAVMMGVGLLGGMIAFGDAVLRVDRVDRSGAC